ncbi:uncharacterized protein BP01DRAFT_386136 [Aspergillus saccharolyticus JOP 1030-1]|uniref:Uncharacterized protein n=1 Tax=Aspergillus saccharolyticus JOP 1030-1 TaxID=1450539 RepID=A0A318ZAM3_9EURO|nr:hypothetical protein BP01DRAFT_386136 [Aspergillus saccharolyticus JOP 1030-1]PYH41763.1 hypothetical protein BP01DRAFT_386136 [Aspergillus saccharolyticus JOP 1030-1]
MLPKLKALLVGGGRSSPPVVSVARLLEILVQSPLNESQPTDSCAAFVQPNDDLDIVLGMMLDARAQSQAQSALNNVRFREWMNQEPSDLLLVNANLRLFALHNVSPISVSFASFVMSMAETRPEDVLSMVLNRRELLNIDFINSRSTLKQLEKHDLYKLCWLLHKLVRQFSSEMTVYRVIDAVSCFDNDLHGSFHELAVVLEFLHAVVQDDTLRARFKVLMTNADQSTKRLRQRVDVEQHVTLNSQYLSPQMISDQSMAAGIEQRKIKVC